MGVLLVNPERVRIAILMVHQEVAKRQMEKLDRDDRIIRYVKDRMQPAKLRVHVKLGSTEDACQRRRRERIDKEYNSANNVLEPCNYCGFFVLGAFNQP